MMLRSADLPRKKLIKPNSQVELQWRENQKLQSRHTVQEKSFIEWISSQLSHRVFTYYEQLLLSSTFLNTPRFIRKRRRSNSTVFRKLPDFIFGWKEINTQTDIHRDQAVVIELTQAPPFNEEGVDPKIITRSLLHYAEIPHVIIYGGQERKFFRLFEEEKLKHATDEDLLLWNTLATTIRTWSNLSFEELQELDE